MRQRIAKFFFQKALDMYNLAEYFNEAPGDEYRRDWAESLGNFYSDVASLLDSEYTFLG